MIGIISSGIEDKIDSLRKGKSIVLEKDHTVILGFDDGIFTLLSELIIANENQKDAAVVVMSEKYDKQEMEDLIRVKTENFKTTRVICRNGNIADFNSLRLLQILKSENRLVLVKRIALLFLRKIDVSGLVLR